MAESSGREKADAVRRMFGSIADRYDFLNHFLSLGIDYWWRRAVVEGIRARVRRPQPSILDVGCGTADLALAFRRLGPAVGCDFSHPMLLRGTRKVEARGARDCVRLLEADALALPFRDAAFDVAVSAFVVRNLSDLPQGLCEMRRILRPGGILGVLDFGMPRWPVLGSLYRYYFLKILPVLGTWLSGVDGPYRYLPESVQSFPPPEDLRRIIEAAGFTRVEYRLLTGGIAVLHLAEVPEKSPAR